MIMRAKDTAVNVAQQLFYWKWEIIALMAGITYILLAMHFVHFQEVILDEGTYLYKGWLFIRGIYHPFQPYGPWTNKMPLAFLLYGVIQWIAGPGLATGRYFSVLSVAVGWFGVWLLIRRLGNRQTAALVLWMGIATIALVRISSWSVTEGICSALMVWALLFILHKRPSNLSLFIGGVLTGLVPVLRINLTLFGLFVPIWTWWLYGWRKARWVLLGTVFPVLVVYAVYWPNILRLWFPWLPSFIQRWLPSYKEMLVIQASSLPTFVSWTRRWGAIADMLRVHPLAWLVLTVSTIVTFFGIWEEDKHPVLFQRQILKGLTALVWGLVLIHLWATLSQNSSLLFQMTVYWAFFAPLVFILGALVWSWYQYPLPRWGRQITAGFAIFLLGVGIERGWYLVKNGSVFIISGLGEWFYKISGLKMFTGPFQNPYLLQGIIMGGMGWFLIVLAGWYTWRRNPHMLQGVKERWKKRPGWAWKTLLIIFIFLSPLPLWSGSFRPYDCSVDSLAQHRIIGEALATVLSPNEIVYLEGLKSVSFLLYLPFDVQTFPPQYNGYFNYLSGGDADILYRMGFWNDTLAKQWRAQSDVLLVSKKIAIEDSNLQLFLKRNNFREFKVTPSLAPCHFPVLQNVVVYKRSHQP